MRVTFDPAALVDLVGDDETLIRRLVAQCVAQTRANWPVLRRVVEAGDLAELASHAHHVKGSLALVGASDCAARLGDVERAAQAGLATDARGWAACEASVHAMLDAMDRWLDPATEVLS